MAYVTSLYGGSSEQVDYRLGLGQHGCGDSAQFGYHADARERPLRWIGEGLAAFGVEEIQAGAELTPERFDAARRLIAGQHPGTGEQLVAPKLAVVPEAKVPLSPLVAAVRARAAEQEMTPAALLESRATSAGVVAVWERAERAVARRGGRAVARVDEAEALARAGGVDPESVWSAEKLETARAAVGQRTRVGIAGYDIGITLPKSMSVLLAFAPDELTDRIEDVYAQATERTFAWTEARTSYVKRGKHGDGHTARQEGSSGFSGWVMTHRAARPVGGAVIGDPHWHVHITIANLARAGDGKWLTVAAGGRELMRHAAAIDKVTQAQIRAELHRELGVGFAASERTGLWEVEHIPTETLQLFSKRHQQVGQVLEKLGYTNATASAKQARVLTRACRSAKSETTAESDTTLREYWRAQALQAGQDPAVWMPAVLAAYQAGHTSAGEPANQAMLADPETGLTAHTRRFSHLDAITATADALPLGGTLEEVERLADLVLSHPRFLALPERGDGQERGKDQERGEVLVERGWGERAQLAGSGQMAGGQLYTTKDVKGFEETILAAARASGPGQGLAVVAPDTLEMVVSVAEAAQGYPLSAEQRRVLAAVVTNGRAVEAVEGAAGTGKTTLMRAARLAWEAQGFVVAGAATAAVAVQGLAAESGIASRTVAQWRHRIRTGAGLAGVDVLVLDEANLTSDRDRAALYQAADRTGTKIVEVGDPKQLRGVGCGSLFGYLHATLDGPALSQNRRQHEEDERATLAAYRAGRYTEALHRWAGRGRVVAEHTSTEGIAAMVTTWMRLSAGAPDPHTQAAGLVMLAATNEQVARINDAVQAVRAAEGQLTGEGRTFALPDGRATRFHVGDHVLIRRNDRYQQAVEGEAVLNGYRGVVTAVTDAGVAVEWRQPGDHPGRDPHTAMLPAGFIAAGGLELGYCLTTHKAEGMTISGSWQRPDGTRNDGSVLVWTPGMDNPGLYVAASRHRGATILFGSLDELEGEREQLLYGTPADHEQLTARVVDALAARAQATETSANDRPVLVDLGHAPTQPHQPRQPSRSVRPIDRSAEQTPEQEPQAEPTPDRTAAAETEAQRVAEQERQRAREQRWQRLREQAAAWRRRGEQWRARAHSTLSDPELAEAITATAATRDRLLASHELTRREVDELTEAVAAGRGPAVTQLDAQLVELRRRAELHHTGAELEQRWAAARGRASMAAAQAEGKQMEAARVSWLRPGLRERLLAEAAELRTQAARAQQLGDQLAAQLEVLHEQLGGDQLGWPYAQGADERRWRAERDYPTDRDQAHRTDQNQLRLLQLRNVDQAAAVTKATTHHDQLLAEQQLRATMPATQRTEEALLRARWHTQQATNAQRQRQRQGGHDRDAGGYDHLRRSQQRGRGRDGPSLGR